MTTRLTRRWPHNTGCLRCGCLHDTEAPVTHLYQMQTADGSACMRHLLGRGPMSRHAGARTAPRHRFAPNATADG